MTENQFTDAVMETLFVRGFVCPPRATVASFVSTDSQRFGPLTDPVVACIESLSSVPDLVRRATDPEKGTFASASGASEEWIAVHEAAHAIVAIKAGLMVRGIRFYGDRLRGELGMEEFAWWESTDEDMLQSLVRLDAAGNIGELLGGFQPNGGYVSRFFDDKDPAQPGNYPSDVIAAWQQHAAHLATVRFEKEGRELSVVELRAPKLAIIEQAEAEAEQILRENADALSRLAEELRHRPMTGADVRAIVEG